MNGFKLFDDLEDLEVMAAHEPSNIIWENLEIDSKQRNKNKCKAFIIIGVMLIVILCGVIYLKVIGSAANQKYPKSHDCSVIEEEFIINKEIN